MVKDHVCFHGHTAGCASVCSICAGNNQHKGVDTPATSWLHNVISNRISLEPNNVMKVGLGVAAVFATLHPKVRGYYPALRTLRFC